MDITQRGVVTLLRSAITGETLPLPEGFDLEAAYPELKKHHMDAMLFEGAVRCGIPRQLPVMQMLFQKYCRALMTSEGQMRQLGRICKAFDDNGIDYMPLKGSKMKSLYPKPELRYMGDADILIRTEQYGKVAPIMAELGFEEKQETDHEIVWRNRELLVELHKHLIPSYNKDFYRYFGNGWQMAHVEAGTRHTMSPEDEWIFQFTHFAKHFRDGGIGCRYVVDLWVFLRANGAMDHQKIRQKLEKLQLIGFYDHIMELIDCWFRGETADDMTDLITDYIFASGSWGREDSRVLSRAVRDVNGKMTSANGKLAYIRKMAFPSAPELEGKYRVLKKAPWMLPAVWIYRPFYKLLAEKHDLSRRKQDMDRITTDSLESRQAFLRHIGLEYHF